MRIVRFSVNGGEKYGVLDQNDLVQEISGSIYEHFSLTDNTYKLGEINLLAPCKPSKAVCVGLNYQAHIDEFKRVNTLEHEEPVLFVKPSTAVIGPGEHVVIPDMSHRVDYEAELAVVIRSVAKDLTPIDSRGVILGYTCANDVTARDLQKKDGQWSRAKGFDTFLPLGPWIETELDPGDLQVQFYLNDEQKQHSSTRKMLFPVDYLVSFVSRVMTLLPGDVILTGTPEGVGPVKDGDLMKVVVQGIGTLANPVAGKPIQH